MFTHLLKLVWKRKTRHLLLSVEIALSFMLVFAVALIMLFLHDLRSLPLGFSGENVWAVQVVPAQSKKSDSQDTADTGALLKQIKQLVRTLPEVEHSAFVEASPYERARFVTSVHAEGNPGARLPVDTYSIDEDAPALLGMTLDEGRWFMAADAESGQTTVVVNRKLAGQMSAGASVVGAAVIQGSETDTAGSRQRILGVIPEFRPLGEYQTSAPYVITPLRTDNWPENRSIALLLKLRAGTERPFEMKLLQTLQRAQPGWTFTVKPLAELAEVERADMATTVLVLMLIAGFMFLMVSFGLFGVLWQHTTQRITEFGLRRALGATAQGLQGQLIVEQLLLSLLAILAATVILIQIPITGVLGELLSWPLFIMSIATAAALILLLSTLCAWYPAWRAGRLSPVVALRYE